MFARLTLLSLVAFVAVTVSANTVPDWCSGTVNQDTFAEVTGTCGSNGATTNGNCLEDTEAGVCEYTDAGNEDCCVVFFPNNGGISVISSGGCHDPCVPKTPMPTPAPAPPTPTTAAPTPTLLGPLDLKLCSGKGVTDESSCKSKCSAEGKGTGVIVSTGESCINNSCSKTKNCNCGSTFFCSNVGLGASPTPSGGMVLSSAVSGLVSVAVAGAAFLL